MTICFSGSFIPQIIKTIKTKSSNDISYGLLFLSLSGHLLALVHAFHNESHNQWLVLGYIIGSMFLLTLIFLKGLYDTKK